MRNRFGFNLLTMSAVVLALGVVMSAALGFYNINNIKRRVFQTRERFNKIELAIQNYVLKNGKFPCPSALNCNENGCENTSDKFGFEKRDSSGNCIYGNLNTAVFKSTNSDSEVILYGAVPFATLGIANNYSVDAWGNKIVYMIPLSLAKDNAFQAMVSQKKDNDNAPEYLKDGLTYMLMSFGRNKQGAFPYNNTSSNYFSGNENMPVDNFTVNEDNKKYLYSTRDFRQFEIAGLEGELQECEELFIEEAFAELSESFSDCITFEYTGSVQNFVIPSGVSEIKLEVYGAEGGSSSTGKAKSSGGLGGYASGTLSVSSGTFYIYVGGKGSDVSGSSNRRGGNGGYNGGGRGGSVSWAGGGAGAGGGGSTDIRFGGTSLSDRIIVAGGGGGGAKTDDINYGNGGSANIADGMDAAERITGGKGGINGGGGGTGSSITGGNGTTGSGGSAGSGAGYYGGGGGGGGYIGGGAGGGGGHTGSFMSGGGGGSGSSYTGGVNNGSVLNSVQSGNGKAIICYDSEGSSDSRSLTFPKAKFGEIVFSKESCPRSVDYPAKSSNYYYMSNYRDGNGVVIDNRAAKRCGRNGKWESGYVYECVKIGKCSKPSTISSYSSKNWSDFNFEIVNTGSVYDKARTVEMKCIINNSSGAKWYDVN